MTKPASRPAPDAAIKKPKTPENPVAGPQLGAKAPAWALPGTAGPLSSAQLKGKAYILYFYPKDDTTGCTAQACGFQAALPAFGKLGVTVIGVSKDSLKKHEKFAAKYDLTFPLASDEEGATLAAYGVWVEKSMYGRKYMGIERSTYLIDGKGIIRAVWRKVNVPGHVDEVMQALKALPPA